MAMPAARKRLVTASSLSRLCRGAGRPRATVSSRRMAGDMGEDVSDPQVAAAAAALRRGDLVVFPTETVYGVGANALDAAAVSRIFAVKGRPTIP